MRIRGKEEVRIFFCYKNIRIYLLHAIVKKKMKIPAKDIKIAIDRMNNYLI
ncbi:MAG: type II toxin-antitoxin system RelE/ParE family toxin [Burkholderiaceae bacterium]